MTGKRVLLYGIALLLSSLLGAYLAGSWEGSLYNDLAGMGDCPSALAECNSMLAECNNQLNILQDNITVAAEWAGMGELLISPAIVEAAPGAIGEDVAAVLAGLSDTRSRVTALVEWIALNLYYSEDNVVRIVDPETGRITKSMITVMLPNETLEVGGGSNEDLALLAYAMLRAEPVEGERVYLVGLYSPFYGGSLGVLVRGNDGLYYLVLPSSASINLIGIFLEVKAVDYSTNNTYRVILSPMDIRPGIKQYLLRENLSVLVYDKIDAGILKPLFWGEPMNNWPSDLGAPSPKSILENWTKLFLFSPTEFYIFDRSNYHVFETLDQLVEWIENQS